MNLPMISNAVSETIVPFCDGLQEIADEHSTEWYEPQSISLDERGMILDCSRSFEKFFCYPSRDLILQHVSSLFPQLKDIELVQKGRFNPLLIFLSRCGKLFQARNMSGDTLSCNLSFVRLENNGNHTLRLIVNPADIAS